MCGIVGYVGKQQAAPILLEGLRQLEYRGYDSAGIALLDNGHLHTLKRKGKIDAGLGPFLGTQSAKGLTGIGHTRWATHGEPSDENSHPHCDQSGRIAIVHNGVVENFEQLKERLKGHLFCSTTDTEVLAHLIGVYYKPGLGTIQRFTQAVRDALREVVGAYSIAAVCADCPGVIIGARRGAPLIVGIGKGENFLASDVAAIATHTRQIIYLKDCDVVTLMNDCYEVHNLGPETSPPKITKLEFDAASGERGKFPHFMLKEIFEQPHTAENILHNWARLMTVALSELRSVKRILLMACGTSWHAALVGEHLFEEFANVPTEVEYASEFRYRKAPLEKNTLVIVITQSGETADTLAALRESRRRGCRVLALCNTVGSTVAREADCVVYLDAGAEIGVASTKTFTAQLMTLTLLALLMAAEQATLSSSGGNKIIWALKAIPVQMESLFAQNDLIKSIALKYAHVRDFFFLGRQYNFPIALEGALKMKEISYLHAEGYPAAEMKHGPLAMIDEKTPTVFILPNDRLYEKNFSNLREIKARKGPLIVLATEGNGRIAGEVNDVVWLPAAPESLVPLLAVLPLQLLAYHIAVARGCDVDKPRNLAKSVTVE